MVEPWSNHGQTMVDHRTNYRHTIVEPRLTNLNLKD